MNTSQTPVVVKIGNTYNDPKHMEILIYNEGQVEDLYDLFPDAAVGSVAYIASGAVRYVLALDGEWVENRTHVYSHTVADAK